MLEEFPAEQLGQFFDPLCPKSSPERPEQHPERGSELKYNCALEGKKNAAKAVLLCKELGSAEPDWGQERGLGSRAGVAHGAARSLSAMSFKDSSFDHQFRRIFLVLF